MFVTISWLLASVTTSSGVKSGGGASGVSISKANDSPLFYMELEIVDVAWPLDSTLNNCGNRNLQGLTRQIIGLTFVY